LRKSNPLASSDDDCPAIVPRYLTAQDYPWLDSLLSEYERFVGRRRAELDQHLEAPLSAAVEPRKLKLARRVLDRLYGDRTEAAIAPRQLRGVVFRSRSVEATRERALRSAARELHVAPESLEEWLFADLPGQRRLVSLAVPLSSAELALEINHALIRALVERAVLVNIGAEGDVRALVRAVKWRGLLCAARSEPGQRRLRLEISGPLALFRRTLVYGRALASLLPRVARCDRFELSAFCALRGTGELRRLNLRSGDPIVAADAHSRYDSGVEERFARDFLRLTDDWDLVREPDAVPVAGHFVFPDFLVRHRRIPGREAWLEIVGFWTPEYLADKLSRLREARLERFILCVDEQRNCADESLPTGARVVRYRRRVPAGEVLKQLAQLWP
jgi:predicted nuclease of restriction endonuclease-like RecB superfamily